MDAEVPRYTRRGVLTAVTGTAVAAGLVGFGTRMAVDADDNGAPGSVAIKLDRTAVEPLARSRHATALLPGGLVLCIGGEGTGGTLASCQVFDSDTGEWYDAAPLSRPRSWHSATPLDGGKVLVLGGQSDGAPLALASIFDPGTDSWSPAKPLATPRFNHAATALTDGRVVLTGGFGYGPIAGAEIYDPN